MCRVTLGPWTQRLWMVHEQLLNADIVLLRGTRLLDWAMVTIMGMLISMHGFSRHICQRFWLEEVGPISHDKIGQISQSLFSLWWSRRKMQRDGASSIQHSTLHHPSWALNPEHDYDQYPDCLPFNLYSAHPRPVLASPPILRANSTILVVRGCILERIEMPSSTTYPPWSYYHDFPDAAHLRFLVHNLSCWSKILLHSSDTKPSPRLLESLCRAILHRTIHWKPTCSTTASPTRTFIYDHRQ
jgi:hypothetical protein